MRIIVTAGPTREYIDPVRFITNASSGRMGCAIAELAAAAGHEVTLVLAEGLPAPTGCRVVRFRSVDDLARALNERFAGCDVLIMAAAVGDFRPKRRSADKISRRAGPITLELVPVEDIVASLARKKRPGQKIVAFAVEEGSAAQIAAAARGKLLDKNADYIVVNTPAAIAAQTSHACILAPDGVALPWADRPKQQLAEEIVRLL